jgi:hypothetical protein
MFSKFEDELGFKVINYPKPLARFREDCYTAHNITHTHVAEWTGQEASIFRRSNILVPVVSPKFCADVRSHEYCLELCSYII